MNRTITVNAIEPAPLSIRHPLGVNLDLTVTMRQQNGSPVDPTLAQFVLLPRSRGGVMSYDMTAADVSTGIASVSVPGTALMDVSGYNIELYSRKPNDVPGDPPLPTGLMARGVLRTEGAGYASQGPMGLINVPVVVGPPGPAGPAGMDGRQGIDGAPGPANVLTIGSVTSGAPGTPADASITGTTPSQVLNLGLPTGNTGPQGIQGVQGAPGPANMLTVGTVTTGAAGSAAQVTITGVSPNQTINFVIPQGLTGATGTNITLGTVLPGSAADGALFWNTSTNTLYVREAGIWEPVLATWA